MHIQAVERMSVYISEIKLQSVSVFVRWLILYLDDLCVILYQEREKKRGEKLTAQSCFSISFIYLLFILSCHIVVILIKVLCTNLFEALSSRLVVS